MDPIKYGLLFERFLNPERVSMPDIDTDVATRIRPTLIKYLKWKYGEKAVCSIARIQSLSFFGLHVILNQKSLGKPNMIILKWR